MLLCKHSRLDGGDERIRHSEESSIKFSPKCMRSPVDRDGQSLASRVCPVCRRSADGNCGCTDVKFWSFPSQLLNSAGWKFDSSQTGTVKSHSSFTYFSALVYGVPSSTCWLVLLKVMDSSSGFRKLIASATDLSSSEYRKKYLLLIHIISSLRFPDFQSFVLSG